MNGTKQQAMTPPGDYTPDADLLLLKDRWRRVGWAVISMVVAVVLAAIAFGGWVLADNRSLMQGKLDAAQKRIDASCSWWYDVGSGDFLGQAPDPAERALVVIIADSRIAFVGQGCPGALPPISPKLARWARFFNLTITP